MMPQQQQMEEETPPPPPDTPLPSDTPPPPPPADAPPPPPDDAPPPPPPASEEPPTGDWRDKRLAKQAAIIAQLRKNAPPDGNPPPPPDGDSVPRADVERLANERAQALASRASFDAQCNAAAAEARKQFADFDTVVKQFGQIVDFTDATEVQRYDAFLEAALETGEAGKIIYTLGKNLDEAERIMALSPVKRATELARLTLVEPESPSTLPKPITPVHGKNAGPSEISPSDPVRADKLSSAEWHKRRAKELADREPQYQRRGAH